MKKTKQANTEQTGKSREKRRLSPLTRRRIIKSADGILAAGILILAIHSLMISYFMVDGALETGNPYPSVALVFLLLGITQLIKIPLHSAKKRKWLLFHLLFALVFFGLAVFIFLSRYSLTALQLAGMGFCLYLMGSRILYTFEKRRKRDIVITLLYCLLILCFFLLFLGGTEPGLELFAQVFLLILIIFKAFGAILIMSFSEIQMGVLLKIIRKTFAAEILAGLLLLIVTFSYIFYDLEPGMATYGDALWYCFAVVTTIGFGDFSAIIPLTRILSVILGIYGIIVVALITSIIVNFYNEVKDHNEEEGEQAP